MYIEFLQNIILFVTCIVILWYTFETSKLRKQAVDQAKFDMIYRIHRQLGNTQATRYRRYIYNEFPQLLKSAIKNTFDNKFCLKPEDDNNFEYNLKRIKDINKDEAKLKQFTNQLWNIEVYKGERALDIVEATILDFEMLALPLFLKIKSSDEIARIYKPLIMKTIKNILPFIVIEKKLRGDTEYKKHFIFLLKQLEIDNEWLQYL